MITNFYEHEPVSQKKPEQLVILLHGLGSNGRDLVSLAPLWAKDIPDALFISPDAPFPCDMVPMGYPDSYQWFSLQDRTPDVMLKGAQEAFPLLETFIQAQLDEFGVKPEKLALVGFSQGTMMSLYTAPRFKGGQIAGVLGYSGALIGADDLDTTPNRPPVCLIHGEADDVVPPQAHAHASAALIKAGFEVSGHTTPQLTHSIDEKGIIEGGKFLKTVLGA